MERPPAELVERFGRTIERFPEAQRRPMFGQPAAFANDHLFTGLFGSDWLVRLPDELRAALLALEGARPFEPMAGRPMREYVLFPPALIQDEDGLARWIEQSLAYVKTLPAKPGKRHRAGTTRNAAS